jgi:copper chaperone NosL
MLLSETRSAAAISLGGDEGSWLLFDDVGCMIDYESSHQGSVRARQVHDWESEIWTDGAAAVYVLADADRVRTPMGSGIAAFASVGGATKLKSAVGGSMLMLDELRGARREWREKRARAGLRP